MIKLVRQWWLKHIARTRRQSFALALRDSHLYGNGFVVRRWHGYRNVNPLSVYFVSCPPPGGVSVQRGSAPPEDQF
jgi:hypothetical protein